MKSPNPAKHGSFYALLGDEDPRTYRQPEGDRKKGNRPERESTLPTSPPDRSGPMTEATGQRLAKLMFAQLLSSGDHVYTAIARTMDGSTIGTTDRYIELYQNNLGREVAVRVALEAGSNMSAAVKLSFGDELSDQNKIDAMSAQGTVNSNWILLKPSQRLYVNTQNTAFTVTGATLRVLLFDPISVFGADLRP